MTKCFWWIIKRHLYIPSQWRYLRCGFISSLRVGLLAQNCVCFLLNSCSSYHCDLSLQERVTNISVPTCLSIVFRFQPVVTPWPSSCPSWEKFYSKVTGSGGERLQGHDYTLIPLTGGNELLYYCVSKTFVAACPSSIYLITDAKLIFVRMLFLSGFALLH